MWSIILTILKSKLVYIGAFVVAYYAPIANLLWVITILTVLDLITGMYRAYKECELPKKRKCIKSRKIRRTAIKLVLYLIAPMSLYLFAMEVFGHHLWLANAAAGLICLTELQSIAENSTQITGNKIFTNIFTKIRKQIEEKISEKIEKPD